MSLPCQRMWPPFSHVYRRRHLIPLRGSLKPILSVGLIRVLMGVKTTFYLRLSLLLYPSSIFSRLLNRKDMMWFCCAHLRNINYPSRWLACSVYFVIEFSWLFIRVERFNSPFHGFLDMLEFGCPESQYLEDDFGSKSKVSVWGSDVRDKYITVIKIRCKYLLH